MGISIVIVQPSLAEWLGAPRELANMEPSAWPLHTASAHQTSALPVTVVVLTNSGHNTSHTVVTKPSWPIGGADAAQEAETGPPWGGCYGEDVAMGLPNSRVAGAAQVPTSSP